MDEDDKFEENIKEEIHDNQMSKEPWESAFDSREDFKEYLRNKMEEYTGERDLEKANERYEMLLEWRQEKDVCN